MQCAERILKEIETHSTYTANVNSKIIDKLWHSSVISKQRHLFLDIFEAAIITDKCLLKSISNLIPSKKTEKILPVRRQFVKLT